jgi:hypothetical protein
MNLSGVFKDLVEPSLERIAVLEVSHIEPHEGREYIVVQTIHRNVFTEFDRKLSRHLAATRGTGFPDYTVTIQVSERGSGSPPRALRPAHYASVPHALKGIAERASLNRDVAALTIHHNDRFADGRAGGVQRHVTPDDIDALNAGLQICRYLGEAEFLSISGDFDIVIASPAGEQRPIVMHLNNGSVSVPCSNGTTITPFECPIHGFAGHIGGSVQAQGYMAQARHALVTTKEDAVMEFRAAAEMQILSFDRALAGRPLIGHRLDAAVALVERLKAGLGSSLNSLSVDARITALDWSSEIAGDATHTDVQAANDAGRHQAHRHVVLAHTAAAGG